MSTTVAILVVLLDLMFIGMMRSSALREQAWRDAQRMPMPTARQVRRWRRDRLRYNPTLARSVYR